MSEGKKTQATLLGQLVQNLGVELFHDNEGAPYATVAPGTTFRLKSSAFQSWLSREYYNSARAAVSAGTMTDTINLLDGSAKYSGKQHKVYVRVAPIGQEVWLDLGKQVAHITADGWQVLDEAPVKFLRPRGVLPLPTPRVTEARELTRLLATVTNIKPEDLPLAAGWLIGALRGRSPFPVLVLTGEQGTAKTFGSQTIRSILDPNIAPLRATPREPRDLMIAARNSYVCAFDNLSIIPDWFSDDLCRLATGAGFATRELHTDTDEIIFQAARPILFNSITDVARRPDLLDRAMVVTLEPIPDHLRMTEGELLREFDAIRPALLGALLDAVVTGLKNEPVTKLPRMPRMADFATLVEAAAPALGWRPLEFLDHYDIRRRGAADDLLSTDPIAEALGALAKPWEGPPTQLYTLLSTQDRRHAKDWPQTAGALSARLKRLAPSLREMGIDVTFKRSARLRHVRVTTVGSGEAQGLPEM